MKGTLSEDGSILVVHIPMRLKRWSAKTEIIAPPGTPDWAPPPPSPQQAMLKALGRAHRWLKILESGKVASMKELAEMEKLDGSYVSRILRLTLLAPDIFTPPAKVFLRSMDVKTVGNDLSAFRKTVVMATERMVTVSGMEINRGGVLSLRSVAPVFDAEHRLVGAAELGNPVLLYLERAAAKSGVHYAVGIDKIIAEKAERPGNTDNDKLVGTDLFFEFSKPEIKQIIHRVGFDPRSTEAALLSYGTHPIVIKSFTLNNFAGFPSVVVSTVADLNDEFRDAFQSALIKAAVVFLAVILAGVFGSSKFRGIQRGLQNSIFGTRRELEEKTVLYEAATAKLAMVDMVKRHFFSTLVIAFREPLQAIAGQCQTLKLLIHAALEAESSAHSLHRAGIVERLDFAVAEAVRLSQLVSDYEQLEMFRQGLVKSDWPAIGLISILGRVLGENRAAKYHLSFIDIQATVAPDLPLVRIDGELWCRALLGLLDYAIHGGVHGTILLTAAVEQTGWLRVGVTGAAFKTAGLLNEELLDSAKQFLSRQAASPAAFQTSNAAVGVVLAQVISEFFGGSLQMDSGDDVQAGFVMRLPTVC